MNGPLEIIKALNVPPLTLPPVTGVLQVGSSIGQELDYFLAHGVTHGAFIEPLDGPFAILRHRCAASDGFLPIQALCGSRDGAEVQFHVALNNGESSSILAPKTHLVHYPEVQFPITMMLNMFTLDRIFGAVTQQRPDIAERINLLFMDVQGAELEVLKGANGVLNRVDYIYTEVSLGGGYEGAATLEDVITALRLYGFRLHEVAIGETGWGNAMFIRLPA